MLEEKIGSYVGILEMDGFIVGWDLGRVD